jgi:hypothetical protein
MEKDRFVLDGSYSGACSVYDASERAGDFAQLVCLSVQKMYTASETVQSPTSAADVRIQCLAQAAEWLTR